MQKHYQQVCGRKIPHTSKAKAMSAVRALFRDKGSKEKPYQCSYGDHWHIGTPMNKQARKEWDSKFNG